VGSARVHPSAILAGGLNDRAERNAHLDLARLRKATAIAAAIREQEQRQGVRMTREAVRLISPEGRRQLERAARVNVSSEETWALVAEQFPWSEGQSWSEAQA